MKINFLTIFPEMFSSFMETSIIGRARTKGILELNTFDIRDYTTNKHKKVDDYPYGGGAGMVMMAQPIFDCMKAVKPQSFNGKCIIMSPRGIPLSTKMAKDLSLENELIILCGHYEGIDERVVSLFDYEISVGDYILTGGELPAMVLTDCVSRFIPGVLGSDESVVDESFSNELLEYPQYTRPSDFNGEKVPEVLLNGNHKKIQEWRHKKSLERTMENRPDLYQKYLMKLKNN